MSLTQTIPVKYRHQLSKKEDNVMANALFTISPLKADTLRNSINEEEEIIPHNRDTTSRDRPHQFHIATHADRILRLFLHIVYHRWLLSRSDCHPFLPDCWNYHDEINFEDGFVSKNID